MTKSNKVVTCDGLATITIKGTASPLCVGDIATHKPFEALLGFERGMGIPVSDNKLDGIIARQDNKFKKARFTEEGIRTKVFKLPQQFLSNSSTLLKNVSEDTLFIDVLPRTIEFVTGKKTTYSKGPDGKIKTVKPKLTVDETILCVLYEYAHDVFKSEVGFNIQVAFTDGRVINYNN